MTMTPPLPSPAPPPRHATPVPFPLPPPHPTGSQLQPRCRVHLRGLPQPRRLDRHLLPDHQRAHDAAIRPMLDRLHVHDLPVDCPHQLLDQDLDVQMRVVGRDKASAEAASASAVARALDPDPDDVPGTASAAAAGAAPAAQAVVGGGGGGAALDVAAEASGACWQLRARETGAALRTCRDLLPGADASHTAAAAPASGHCAGVGGKSSM